MVSGDSCPVAGEFPRIHRPRDQDAAPGKGEAGGIERADGSSRGETARGMAADSRISTTPRQTRGAGRARHPQLGRGTHLLPTVELAWLFATGAPLLVVT